ncbi:hypothetical protein NIES4071_88350 [Calothrix sp. NIES-4071]|nr:hypothetical protein NIES4071_88350 [Calothrix sp. NIES-4071]BAZ63102.1 hypothetical protein NIES4105_88280 [Calothrix sp. NIES-4105]
MRESPIGIVIALLVTFGLGAGSIWWAYQVGFGSQSNSVQALPDSTSEMGVPVFSQSPVQQTPTQEATPTLTPTPQPVKIDDAQLPIEERVKFVIDTNQLTSSGQQALEKLANTAIKYTKKDVILPINVGVAESEYSQTLAQQRGESIAAYFRDKGFSKKIIISKNNVEDIKQRRTTVEVSLNKN